MHKQLNDFHSHPGTRKSNYSKTLIYFMNK